MNTLAVIKNREVTVTLGDTANFERRQAARAVVFGPLGQVALLYVSKEDFHKLPGGGIEPGESYVQALCREVQEETGCDIEKSPTELGKIVERRDSEQLIQTSFCYIAKQKGEQQKNDLTDEERKAGYEIVWAKDIDDAIATFEADKPSKDGKRINPRDLIVLKAAKDWLCRPGISE